MIARRILLLVTDLELGGTPTVVRELAIRLQADPAVVVHVACLARHGPVVDQLQAAGVLVTALGARRSTDIRILPRLVQLIKTQRFDTVFSFLIHANALAAAASLWVRGVRWIQSIQTTQPYPRWHWLVQRLVHGAAELVVVPTPSVAAAAHQWSNIPADKIVIIPNAIDPMEFEDSAIPTASPQPYPITFIGRLDPIKDIPTLIGAVGQLDRLVHLHIWGDGKARARITEEIDRQDLRDAVTLHGPIDHPQPALAQSGLLILPSLAEGFGLVLIEAMAGGVPVIGTNVPGIRDVIQPGRTGLLVPPGDETSLADAIRRVVTNRDFRLQLIDAAHRDVQRFTWNVVLEHYRRLLHLI